jgi:hypothetical protein
MSFLLYRICFSLTLCCQVTLFSLVVLVPLLEFRWHPGHPVMWLLSWWPFFALLLTASAVFAVLAVVFRDRCLRRLR